MSISRPRTAQSSRPATAARPQTAASSRHEGSYVVAVIEARSVSREVGLAALDRDTGRLALVQVSAGRLELYSSNLAISAYMLKPASGI